MLHGFKFPKLVLWSTLIFTHSNASNSQLLQFYGTYTLGMRRTPDQTDSDVTCSGSCDQGKIARM